VGCSSLGEPAQLSLRYASLVWSRSVTEVYYKAGDQSSLRHQAACSTASIALHRAVWPVAWWPMPELLAQEIDQDLHFLRHVRA
jgi:hypothetical protein